MMSCLLNCYSEELATVLLPPGKMIETKFIYYMYLVHKLSLNEI